MGKAGAINWRTVKIDYDKLSPEDKQRLERFTDHLAELIMKYVIEPKVKAEAEVRAAASGTPAS